MREENIPISTIYGVVTTCAIFHQGEQGERGLNGDDGLPGPQVGEISWFYKKMFYMVK